MLLTVPYPPARVVEIIGDFQNLTWSGSPPDTVTLNGTDNQVGTARAYTLSGLDVVETLSEYYRPSLNCFGTPYQPNVARYAVNMAYVEAHTFAEASFEGDKVYMPFDGISVASTCLGNASVLNYTANFCATNVSMTQSLLHSLHMQDLDNVQAELGNNSYTSCVGLWSGSCL